MNIRQIARVAVYTAITCTVAMAFRYAPAAYIPFSMLPVMVLLAGFVLGPKLGAISMALYTLLGLIGVPVFAKGGGPTYILTPSFGFVLGYIFAAYAVGKLLELKKSSGFYWSALAVLAGLTCLYLVGLSYFYVIINF
ncbi:MAG TPA: biotin transporter BioY, partial [Verrucomicrobiae bacterium]|nr:biotin transporter BioY [Verrucomicrobiae bacterium]